MALEEKIERRKKPDIGEHMRKRVSVSEEDLNGVIFKIADTKEELEGAFKLIHDRYVDQKYIDPDESGLKCNIYNALPLTTVFVGKKDDEVVATMAIIPDSELGLPLDSIYRDEIQPIRDQGRYIGEVGAFAINKESSSINSICHLNKIMHTYGKHHLKLDDLMITVKKIHKGFYEHALMFEQVDGPKYYEDVRRLAVAMRLNLDTNKERYRKVYEGKSFEKDLHDFHFVRKSDCIYLPEEKEPVKVMNEELFNYFFNEKTNLAKNEDKEKIDYVLNLYKE